MHTMTGVLEQIRRSKRKLVKDNASSAKIDQKVLELQAAMEILAEVFDTDIPDVDEMINLRYKEGGEDITGIIFSQKAESDAS